MTFDEFVTKYNGQAVETEDPTNLNQCMDLAFAWCDAIGVPRETIRHLNSFEVWTKPLDITLQYFDYIPNTPHGVPAQGDIVVFDQRVGPYGHVAIASGKGDPNWFTGFSQNWSGVASAQMVEYRYDGVCGWLHKKQTIAGSESSDAFLQVCTKLQVSPDLQSALTKINELLAGTSSASSSGQVSLQLNKEQVAQLSSGFSWLMTRVSPTVTSKQLQTILNFLKGKKTIIVGALMITIGLVQGDSFWVLQGLGIIGLRIAVLGSSSNGTVQTNSSLTQ